MGRPGGIGGIGPGGVNVRPGGVGVGASGTRRVAAGALGAQAGAVRNGFASQYPGLTARWLGPTWRPLAWGALASYGGYGTEPAYYDYGTTAVYEGDSVYVNGETAATPEQYAEQATAIAEAGQTTSAAQDDEPMTVGVFGMVQGDETTATQIFQIKLNKQGLISGEYYNATTDQTSPISGSVDKKSQRAAWTIADKKTPVYEAGIANLTKAETTMMVHFSNDRSQQFTLVRIDP